MKNPSLTPHGPEFSFVDSCKVFPDEKRAVGSKWLDPEIPFFAAHFPGHPLMPGVLMVEAAAQTSGILWQTLAKLDAGTPAYLAQVEKFRFLKAVLPGQTLEIETVLQREFESIALFQARLSVNATPVAKGELMLARRLKED